MILRRLTANVKAQNWTAIAIEFVIFLALAMLGIYSWYRLWSKREVEADV